MYLENSELFAAGEASTTVISPFSLFKLVVKVLLRYALQYSDVLRHVNNRRGRLLVLWYILHDSNMRRDT